MGACQSKKVVPVENDKEHLTYGKPGVRALTRTFTTSRFTGITQAVADGVRVVTDALGMTESREDLDAEATAKIPEDLEKYMGLVRCVRLFDLMGEAEVEATARDLEVRHFKEGEIIYDEGDDGHECWILEEGVCFASKLVWSTGKAEFHKGRMRVVSNQKEWKETRTYKPGKFGSYFGERSLVRKEPRNLRITCRTDVKAVRIKAETYVKCARIREYKEHLIRRCDIFETMTDDQVGKLAALLKKRLFASGDTLMTQGAEDPNFYILETGEAISSEGKTYQPGSLFNEQVLLTNGPCPGTVHAKTEVVAYVISRDDFETRLGPLSKLQAEQFAMDPRKLISDFYQAGDQAGPAGLLATDQRTADPSKPATQWFAVYRPCSRDSIAKMLGTTGVGKGLNVKGKSAKKNRLSGFVPFLQISDNAHKAAVEAAPKAARTHVYYRNVIARQTAEQLLNEVMAEADGLDIEERVIRVIPDCEPQSFGLDVPEPVLKEAYIMRPDLTPVIGWETGRASEPAFMDMNLHSVRDGARGATTPNVVLYQFDLSDPMNPHGLLIAYAEEYNGRLGVKPVCSDFDTFTVGSRGMAYHDPLPPEQCDLLHWALRHTGRLLDEPSPKGWMSRWLEVLKEEAGKGFHPSLSKFGFGDPTSYGLIGKVVEATASCGAVRHGAECFNFFFPQDLDDEYLIVWDGFQNPPWRAAKEPEVRDFLLARCRDGYSFPLNPVWPIRDKGWFDVLTALRANPEGQRNLNVWYNDPTVLQRIEELHAKHPSGFRPLPVPPGLERSASSKSSGKHLKTMALAMNLLAAHEDLDTREMGYFVEAELRGEIKLRWKRVRKALKLVLLQHKQ